MRIIKARYKGFLFFIVNSNKNLISKVVHFHSVLIFVIKRKCIQIHWILLLSPSGEQIDRNIF